MLGAELKPLNRGFDLGVVAARWFELQLEQNLSNRSAIGNCCNQVGVRPASAAVLLRLMGVCLDQGVGGLARDGVFEFG